MADNYEALTVKALKDEAAKRDGLTLKSGLRKAEIIEKLREWDDEQSAQQETKDDAPEETEEAVAASDDNGEAAAKANEDAAADDEEVVDTNATEPASTPVPKQDDTPPAIETAPQEVSALSEPAKEPTPPPHHATIEPVESSDGPPTLTTALGVSDHDFALPSESTNAVAKDATEPLSQSVPLSEETSVSSSEIIEDSRKRKRRSMTPPVEAEEVAEKRARIEEVTDNDVSFSEAPAEESKEDVKLDAMDVDEHVKVVSMGINEEDDVKADRRKPETVKKEPRKPSFMMPPPSQRSPSPGAVAPRDEDIEPALHLASAGIYIANLKRPLQEAALRRHLEKLAASKNDSTESSSPLQLLHLDQVKTHALALFDSMTAASRVRAALHHTYFPVNETGRDPLFVDFIPDDKVGEWINKEKGADGTGRTGGIRWHVIYTPDGEAVHEEVGSRGSISRAPSTVTPLSRNNSITAAPTAPVASKIPPSPSRPALPPPFSATGVNSTPLPPRQSASFGALSKRFSETKTKPRLYFTTVDPALAQKRLDIFRDETSRDWRETDRKLGDELYRYSFEKGDRFVSTGVSRGAFHMAPKERDIERRFRLGRDGDRSRG
jgi:hypothetical protein